MTADITSLEKYREKLKKKTPEREELAKDLYYHAKRGAERILANDPTFLGADPRDMGLFASLTAMDLLDKAREAAKEEGIPLITSPREPHLDPV